MDRKLLVSLLRKNIQELDMITEGFMEMNEFPKAILLLAERKTNDIYDYIAQLSGFEPQASIRESVVDVLPESAPERLTEMVEISSVEAESAPTIETDNAQDELETVPELVTDLSTEHVETPVLTNDVDGIDAEVVVDSKEEKPAFVTTLNDRLSKTDTSIGASLANKKIQDIKQAISIGDRFRFQRELFKNNGEEMNKSLHYINLLATYEEAISFLGSKYNWDMESETANDFIQIVKRRFL